MNILIKLEPLFLTKDASRTISGYRNSFQDNYLDKRLILNFDDIIFWITEWLKYLILRTIIDIKQKYQ